MTTENDRDRDKIGLCVQGHSEGIERLVNDTEEAIVNTRHFLDQILASQEQSRRLVLESLRVLEDKRERLYAKRDEAEPDFGNSGSDQQE